VKADDFIAQIKSCRAIPGSVEKVPIGMDKDGRIKYGVVQTYECQYQEKPAYLKPVDPNLKVDPLELKQGIQHEMEHTDDFEVAKKIALHHLAEHPYYYTHLEKMEKELENVEKEIKPILEYVGKIPDIKIKQKSKGKTKEPDLLLQAVELLEGVSPYLVSERPGEKITDLSLKYSSSDITKMAKQHRIPLGSKMKMITALVEKGVEL